MQPSQLPHAVRPGLGLLQPAVLGTLLGCVSAVAYTAANIFLRASIHSDPMWVSCVKAFPTVAIVSPWLVWHLLTGRQAIPSLRTIGLLAAAGLLAQFGGNVVFQWSLGIIGIALTVPLCIGAIILGSAFLGRIFLHEAITLRTVLSMVLLMIAIWSLSLGAGEAWRGIAAEPPSFWLLAAGVGGACFSGCAYAAMGTVIRYCVVGRASVAVSMLTTTLIGLTTLGAASFLRIGWSGIASTESADWQAMLLAGACNFIAYLALTKSLQLTSLVYINALNASQVAMAAVAGVILFDEVPSIALGAGVALTVGGLLLMPRQTGRQAGRGTSDHRSSDLERAEGVVKERKRSSSSPSSASSQSERSESSVSEKTGQGSVLAVEAACAHEGRRAD